MKKTQEVLGLPIISISDGVEVGKVKSILVNADEGTVDYIVVDSGIQILSARVISTSSVLGMGEYALTIENDSAINDIGRIPAAIDLLQKNIQVKGSKVLTKKGRLIGEIGDFFFDEDNNCRITGLEYIADITHKKVRIIPRNNVITFGKNLIVVTEEVESNLLDNSSQLSSAGVQKEQQKKNWDNIDKDNIEEDVNSINKAIDELSADIDKLIAKEGDTFFNKAQGPDTNINQENNIYTSDTVQDNSGSQNQSVQDISAETDLGGSDEKDDDIKKQEEKNYTDIQGYINTDSKLKTSTQSLFEQRQRQYLKGRKATKTITDNLGKVIINSGEVISEDVIDIAKNNGKLIELVMNNKA
ncbi:MAG TPA: PRC-barrel domain-containing protein [Pseudobacteroides sp.]|nr:PRC-barrel domain-containing protein [Pseudobacteroides sp.]